MARILKNRRLVDVLTALGLLGAIAALLIYPAEAVAAAKSGLALCGNVIIPSLFPFFVLSSLCVELGLIHYLGRALEPVMEPLFGVGGACSAAFALGIIGGYPVGARTAIALYDKGCCTKREAERLLAFCNNSGPAFILGVVGAGVFGSSRVGVVLYLTHVASSVLVGALFRIAAGKKAGGGSGRAQTRARMPFPAAFTASVKDAFSSVLSICGFVIFFTVVIRIAFLSGAMSALSGALGTLLRPLGFGPEWAEKLLIGAIEMSSGVWSLQSASGTLTGKMAMAAFILGWAGVSVHCQVLSFIGASGLSTRPYLLGKLLHGAVSAALTAAVCRAIPLETSATGYYASRVAAIAQMDFSTVLRASLTACALILLLLFSCAALYRKNALEKRARL